MKIGKFNIDTYYYLIYNPYSNCVHCGNNVSFYFSGPKSKPGLHATVSCYVSLMYIKCFGVFHCLLWHWCFWRVQTSYFAEYTSIWVGLMSPWASQVIKNLPANARRHKRPGFDPWVGKISWRRAWQPTQVFFPGESHGQKSLVGYSPVPGVAKSWMRLKLLSMHACMSPHD